MADVKMVLEDLKELLEIHLNPFVDDCTQEAIQTIRELQEKLELPDNYQIGFQDGYVRALESSEKSEEVCEWKKASEDDMSIWTYYPECEGMTDVDISGFHYCPYCGKKIKVVWYDKRRTDFCI